MIEKLFAALVLAICLVLMVRLLLGPRRRARFDAGARRAWQRLQAASHAAWHWRTHRRSQREAERVAEEAIRRAQGRSKGAPEGEWDGNVYKPKSFRKDRKLH